MPDLHDRLSAAVKDAMKAQQKDRLAVIRMLLAEVKSAQLSADGGVSAEAAVSAYAKRLRKSAEEYRRLAQPDRATQAEQELKIVEEFLPQQLSRADAEALVERVLRENSISSPKQMGQAMKLIMSEYGSQVEGKVVQEIIKAKLTAAS